MARRFLFGLLLIASFFSIAAQGDRSYSADRFDVAVVAQEDRSLIVTETVTFRFVGGPFSFVFRELPVDHTDGIVDILAGVDGEVWPHGTGPGQVEIVNGDPIVVTWHLSPTSDKTQTFTLSYRALGVVRGGATDQLDWQALPDEYEYDIASSRATVEFPAAAGLTGPPEVLVGKAEAAQTGNQAIFTQGNLSAGDPLVVRLNFAPGAFDDSLPAWQTQREAQNSRAWMWLTAAGVTLIGGLLAVFAAARPYQNTTRQATSFLHKPPFDLPPAMAGYLFNQTVAWPHGLGTLFDLAGRGFIRIEESAEKKWWRSNEFNVTLLERPTGLQPHEQALLDMLFTDRTGATQNTIAMSDMGRLITSSRWKDYSEALKGEAEAQGLLSAAAERRRNHLLAWGLILMILLIPLAVVTWLIAGTFGWWPFIVGGALFVVGLFALIAAATVSPLSERGAQLATTFDPFRRFLQEVAKGKMDVPDPAYYEAYLPYATAFGHAEPWVKDQAKKGYDVVPSYFSALSDDGGSSMMVVYLAAITAASHSGGSASASAAGAAGAGAAGGGASGAG